MDVNQFLPSLVAAHNAADIAKLRGAAMEEENKYRELFARSREDWDVPELDNPYQSLIPVFQTIENTPNAFALRDPPNLPMVFQQEVPEWKANSPAVVDRQTFAHQFDLFTENMLRNINWDNVLCAGGSVLGCLLPIPPESRVRSKAIRSYFHDEAFPGSDIDLFLWGLTEEEANKRVTEIYECVADACPYEVICFRSAYAISIVSQYPFRHVQIVLRLYTSPFEVLAGFDVDSCAVGYNGKDVFLTPRAHLALVTRTNVVDMTRRSPTYELRLEKYAKRGFQVAVPGLIRHRIDPMIYEQQFGTVFGLKRLLVLEKLRTSSDRQRYKEMGFLKTNRRQNNNNVWLTARLDGLRGEGAEASDYSTVFIPWGPGWDALACKKVMQKKDFLLNSDFANGFRGYPLHPCFMGTAAEVLEDCFPDDGELPPHADSELTKHHVRGRITWLTDNPGRQMIGSFNPITEGDWMEGAMLSENVQGLVVQACSGDAQALVAFLDAHPEENISNRDRCGRTALLMSAFVGSPECVGACLDRGASVDERLADGRNILHIAAAYGWHEIVDLVMQRSDIDGKAVLNAADDRSMTPLYWAVALGQLRLARLLIHYGATATPSPTVSTTKQFNASVGANVITHEAIHPLLFAVHLMTWSEDLARNMVQELLRAGASYAQMSKNCNTIIHCLAISQHISYTTKFLQIIFEEEPDLAPQQAQLINTLNAQCELPLTLAIKSNNWSYAHFLLEKGASISITQTMKDSWTRLTAIQRRGGLQSHNGAAYAPDPCIVLLNCMLQLRNNCVTAAQTRQLTAALDLLDLMVDHGFNLGGEKSQTHVGINHATTYADVLAVIQRGVEQTNVQAEPVDLNLVMSRCLPYFQALAEVDNNCASCDTYVKFATHTLLEDATEQVAQAIRQKNTNDVGFSYSMGYYSMPISKVGNLSPEEFSTWKQSVLAHMAKLLEGLEINPKVYENVPVPYANLPQLPVLEDAVALAQEVRKACQLKVTRHFYYAEGPYNGHQPSLKPLPSDKAKQYLELFEAAFRGDTARIQELTANSINAEPDLLMCVFNELHHTPFSLAVMNNHLETAQAIMDVAAKQYELFLQIQDECQQSDNDQMQQQITGAATAHGKSSTFGLLTKIDNLALAATGELTQLGPTVYSPIQGLNIADETKNIPASVSPAVLLLTSAAIPACVLKQFVTTVNESLIEQLPTLVSDPPALLAYIQQSSQKNQQGYYCCEVILLAVLLGRTNTVLTLFDMCEDIQRRGVVDEIIAGARAEYGMVLNDDVVFAAQVFTKIGTNNDAMWKAIFASDNVELLEGLIQKFGAFLPFDSLLTLLRKMDDEKLAKFAKEIKLSLAVNPSIMQIQKRRARRARQTEALPTGSSTFPCLLKYAVEFQSTNIMQCFNSGRATALLEEYLQVHSDQLHAKIACKCKELIQEDFQENSAVENPIWILQLMPSSGLGDAIFTDWFFSTNKSILKDAIQNFDIEQLKFIHKHAGSEVWHAMLNNQLINVVHMLVTSMITQGAKLKQDLRQKIIDVIDWCFAHGAAVLGPLRLCLGTVITSADQSNIDHYRSAALSFSGAVDPSDYPLSKRWRVVRLKSLFQLTHPDLFAAIIRHFSAQDITTINGVLANSGCSVMHLLAGMNTQPAREILDHWLRASHGENFALQGDVEKAVNVYNNENETPLHIAARQKASQMFKHLMSFYDQSTDEQNNEQALAAISILRGDQVPTYSDERSSAEDEHGQCAYDVAAAVCIENVKAVVEQWFSATARHGGYSQPNIAQDSAAPSNPQDVIYLQSIARLERKRRTFPSDFASTDTNSAMAAMGDGQSMQNFGGLTSLFGRSGGLSGGPSSILTKQTTLSRLSIFGLGPNAKQAKKSTGPQIRAVPMRVRHMF